MFNFHFHHHQTQNVHVRSSLVRWGHDQWHQIHLVFLDESEHRGMMGMSKGRRWKTSSSQLLISSQTTASHRAVQSAVGMGGAGLLIGQILSLQLKRLKWSEVGQWGVGVGWCMERERDIPVRQWMKCDNRRRSWWFVLYSVRIIFCVVYIYSTVYIVWT